MTKPRRIIGRVLAAAVRVWLRSQLNSVTNLQLDISSGNRQLLSGNIPQVSLAAQEAIYQGIYLSQIRVVAHQIRVNIKQVLRGQPLQLLAPVPIDLTATLLGANLEQSLSAPLLKPAVLDLLRMLLKPHLDLEQVSVVDFNQVQLHRGRLTLQVHIAAESPFTGCLRTGFKLGQPNELRLCELDWQQERAESSIQTLRDYTIDLGPDVALQQLEITPTSINCRGRVQIQP